MEPRARCALASLPMLAALGWVGMAWGGCSGGEENKRNLVYGLFSSVAFTRHVGTVGFVWLARQNGIVLFAAPPRF